MADKIFKADPASAWCMAGFFVSGFTMIVMATISSAIVAATRAETVFVGLMAAGACFVGWLALKTVVGAARGMPRVKVSETRIMAQGALGGTRWAEWSSLSNFAVSAAGSKRKPVATARIVGDAIGPNLRGKTEFAIGGALRVSIATLTDELNARRPLSAGPAAATPPEDAQARLAAAGPSRMSRSAIVLTWCLSVGQCVWLYTMLFQD